MSEQTIQAEINRIYEENFSHIDFMDNMGGDCDCNIHQLLTQLCLSIGWNPVTESESA